ncbi:hypothetical protein [uncultured Deinococcus sp.]|uniref:hypothetical protein n=1 Tax=uncultured Deinococcus sp. TaxID=158789 RepID=UPI00258422F0|nr:hypothetical protein [uncultured Deinococcus sp.]
MSAYLRLNVRDAVKVGGQTLPGVLSSLSVSGNLEITQDKLSGSSTHLTSIEGYTTASVALEIILLGSDKSREAQLRTINATFSVNPPDGTTKGNAKAWRVVNPHLDARRIRQMLFTRFDSRDGNEDDSTVVSLEFREILQEQARLEKAEEQDAATDPQTGELSLPSSQAAAPGAGTTPAPPAPLSPFAQGLKNGTAVANPTPLPATPGAPSGGGAVLTP